MPPIHLVDLINIGSVSLMAFAFVTGASGLWVWGWVYREEKRRADKWEEIARRGNQGWRDTIREINDQ